MGIRMGRGRRGALNELTVPPMRVGLVVGVLGFGLMRYGVPAWLSGQSRPLAQTLGKTDASAPTAWIVLAACAMAMFVSCSTRVADHHSTRHGIPTRYCSPAHASR